MSKTVENIEEYKLRECAEIAKGYFTPETIRNWENLSVKKRKKYANSFCLAIADELGVQCKGIRWTNAPLVFSWAWKWDRIRSGWDIIRQDGYIGIDNILVENPHNLRSGIDAIARETRHKFQCDMLEGKVSVPIDDLTRKKWDAAYKEMYDQTFDGDRLDNLLEIDILRFGKGAAAAVNTGRAAQ